jgi:antitoxin ParD1/3/4
LPLPLKAWVEEQVGEKGFSTASEYIRDLLRREQARAEMDSRLTDALNSGPSAPMTGRDWQRIRAEGMKQVRKTGKR